MEPTQPKSSQDQLMDAVALWLNAQAKETNSKRKRWIALTVVAIFFGASSAIIQLFDGPMAKTKNYAALVRIDGEIGTGHLASMSVLNDSLTQAFEDDKAQCVALAINSPGGMVGQSQLIHDEILKLANKNHRKVIAVGEDLMASGGYMIATSASRIYALPSAIVGSIGVIQSGYDISELASRYGIKDRTFTAGQMKDSFNPLVKTTPEAKAKAEEVLTEMHGMFIDMVKQSRGTRINAEDPQLFTGTFWTGAHAAKLGLIDGLSDLQDAIKTECGADSVKEYVPHLSAMDLISAITKR